MKKILPIVGILGLISCGSNGQEQKRLDNENERSLESEPSLDNNNAKVALDESSSSITLKFADVRSTQGNICFSVFDDPSKFPKDAEGAFYATCVPAADQASTISNLQAGTFYGIAVFHDENGNGVLDERKLGPVAVPAEGYGFSNNPGFKPSPASFDEVRFRFEPGIEELVIDMTYLF